MGAKVIIEGVEENNQLQAMRQLELDYYQGFYLGKPSAIHHWTEYAPANARCIKLISSCRISHTNYPNKKKRRTHVGAFCMYGFER